MMQYNTEQRETTVNSVFCFLVIVGGNTMWLQWLIHGMPDAPRATEEVKEHGKEIKGKGCMNNTFDAIHTTRTILTYIK